MTYIFDDDFETGSLKSEYSSTTPAVSISTLAAYSGRYGMSQVADGVNAGVAAFSDTLLPNGDTYCFASFKFKQVSHTAGNSPVITIQNRTGSDHFDLFVNYNTDSKFWWDMISTNNAQSSFTVTLDQWYDMKVIVYFGATQWNANVWIDGVKQQPIYSTKTVSDVRAVHIGGFGTDTNTRYYDNLTLYTLKVDPETAMTFNNLSTEDLLRLFLLKFITPTDITQLETTTSDYLGKLVNTAGDVIRTDDVVP